MAARALLLLLPLSVPWSMAAQTPRDDAEQALRSRVTEFFQDFLDAQYRKALDLVAEDTKDEYFASSKMEIKAFKIEDVKLDDSLTKANVNLTVKRVWRVRLDSAIVETPMPTTWKIENGKWVWYHEMAPNAHVTPMGPSDIQLVTRKPDGTVDLPQDLSPNALLAAAQKILKQTNIDKQEVTLATNRPSSDKVTFHNGAQGSVGLEITGIPKLPGFTAKLDKTTLNFDEDTVLQIQYAPSADQDKSAIPVQTELTLVVSPFNQQFHIQVKFQDSPK